MPRLWRDCRETSKTTCSDIGWSCVVYLGFSCYENKRGTAALPPEAAIKLILVKGSANDPKRTYINLMNLVA